jgi:hypothetical protein
VLSRVIPKFLSEEQNLTEVPLMFMNSGNGSDLATLFGVTNRTSVLSSFIWSLLDSIHVLISDTHFSIQRMVEGKSLALQDLYTCVSSAYSM